MISDVRKQMRDLGVTYEDICHYIRGGIRGADAMREMGFSDTVVCDVTGIKSDNEPGTCVISRRWAPLIYAPFEVTKECCPIHKTGPIHELEKTLGNLQPMIGEMAENSQTRMNSYRQTGCNMFKDGVGVSKPMGPMTGQTVAWYYHTAGIPLAPPYGEPLLVDGYYKYSGEQNTGCKLCGFGIMYDWDRFDRLKAIEPETVRWAFKPIADGGLSYGEVCRFINTDCRGKIVIPKT